MEPDIQDEARRRILVIDDEAAVCRLIQIILGRRYDVETVNDSTEAIALLCTVAPFDLVICDYTLPGLSGADLLREIRAVAPAVPCLVVTGWPPNQVDAEGYEMLQKPIKPQELLARVEELLEAG